MRYTRHAAGGYDKRYYHQDAQNSVVAVTDGNGALVGAPLFDAWGNAVPGAPLGRIERYGYTGREPDASGLIYYRARYYDPTLARFTQRDPSGLAGGLNPYAYVGNDPVNYIDPSGLVRASPVSTSNETAYGGGCLSANGYDGDGTLSDAEVAHGEVEFGEEAVRLAFGLFGCLTGQSASQAMLGSGATAWTSNPGFSANPPRGREDGLEEFLPSERLRGDNITTTPGEVLTDFLVGLPGRLMEAVNRGPMILIRPAVLLDLGNVVAQEAANRVHGNSRASTAIQHRYEIFVTATGDVVKTGISGGALNANGTSARANSQVNALNRAEGQGTYSASVRETNVPGRQA